MLQSQIETYRDREVSLNSRDKLIYATLLLLEPTVDRFRVHELASSIRASSPDTWMSDLANLLSLTSFPSVSPVDKIVEIERVITEIDFARILASEDPFVDIYKAKGLSEELGMDSLTVQLAFAHRDMKNFEKAREVSVGIKNQDMREHCLKQIDYFERKKNPQNATKRTATNNNRPKTESFSSGSQPPNEKAELIQTADEKPAEVAAVKPIEEPVEKSLNWWLWLIGLLVFLGGIGLAVRRKW